MMNASFEQIAQRIKKAKSVAIFTHMRPDGDAIGSAFSLAHALTFLHIPHKVYVESDIPSRLTKIQGEEKVEKYPQEPFDLLVSVDCSDVQRLGALSDDFLRATRKKIDTINIDHHVSNTRFATYNYVRVCAANCMNMATLIEYMGAPIDKKVAECLMAGLITDSGNFSHDDVDEEVFLLAAKLSKAGAFVHALSYELLHKQTKERAALYARTMSGMRYFHDNRFALIVVSKENLVACNADQSMTEGFVDFPLSIDSVEVAASILEVKYRQYKISLRTKTYADANKIAGTFGGGGHVRAAGCMLFGDLEDVIDKLAFTVSQYLED